MAASSRIGRETGHRLLRESNMTEKQANKLAGVVRMMHLGVATNLCPKPCGKDPTHEVLVEKMS